MFPGESSLNTREQSSARILEIIEIQCSEDGECYAQKLKVLFGLVDDGELQPTHPISENVVESVLNYIRQCEFNDTHDIRFSSLCRPLTSSNGYFPDWLRHFTAHISRGIGDVYRLYFYGSSLRSSNRILWSCVSSAFRYATRILE